MTLTKAQSGASQGSYRGCSVREVAPQHASTGPIRVTAGHHLAAQWAGCGGQQLPPRITRASKYLWAAVRVCCYLHHGGGPHAPTAIAFPRKLCSILQNHLQRFHLFLFFLEHLKYSLFFFPLPSLLLLLETSTFDRFPFLRPPCSTSRPDDETARLSAIS